MSAQPGLTARSTATESPPEPVLVIAVGNPSRGDDSIGPRLAARLEAAALPGVEVLCDFQLQVEHALDLEGRQRVVFVDAGTGTASPYELRRVLADEDWRHTSHALSPEAVLATWARLRSDPPPCCWVVCVRGECFDLGAGLSGPAARHLEAAWPALMGLLARPAVDAP